MTIYTIFLFAVEFFAISCLAFLILDYFRWLKSDVDGVFVLIVTFFVLIIAWYAFPEMALLHFVAYTFLGIAAVLGVIVVTMTLDALDHEEKKLD